MFNVMDTLLMKLVSKLFSSIAQIQQIQQQSPPTTPTTSTILTFPTLTNNTNTNTPNNTTSTSVEITTDEEREIAEVKRTYFTMLHTLVSSGNLINVLRSPSKLVYLSGSSISPPGRLLTLLLFYL